MGSETCIRDSVWSLLPKEIYGNYKYVLSLAGMVGALMLSGMGTAILRSVARGFEGAIRHGLGLYARFSLLGASTALVTALYYWLNDNNTLALSLLIAGISLPIFNSAALFQPILVGHKEFKLHAKYTIIKNLVPTILLISVATLVNDSVPLLVLVYFFGYATTTYVLLRLTLRRFPPNDKLDEKDIIYGKHLSVMNAFSLVAEQLDKVLIFQLVGAVEVAVYAFAEAMPKQIHRFFKMTRSLIFPKFSANHKSLSFKNILYKSSLFTAVIIAVVLCYILLAELIFTFLFPAYTEAILFSQILALQLIPLAFGFFPGVALKASRAQKKLYIHSVIVPAINITVLIGLVYFYGVLGAVYARIIGRTVSASLSVVLFYLHQRGR